MNQRKEFLGRGWAYPIAFEPQTSTVTMAEYEEDVRQAILIILGTCPGERVMRPDFGCGIHDLVFTTLDTAALTRVRVAVEDALTKYEPRIEFTDVRVDPIQALSGQLLVEIGYRVRATNQTGNLVYPFHFREGGHV